MANTETINHKIVRNYFLWDFNIKCLSTLNEEKIRKINIYQLEMWKTEFVNCQESSFLLNILAYYRMKENNTNIKELIDKTEGVMTNNLAISVI